MLFFNILTWCQHASVHVRISEYVDLGIHDLSKLDEDPPWVGEIKLGIWILLTVWHFFGAKAWNSHGFQRNFRAKACNYHRKALKSSVPWHTYQKLRVFYAFLNFSDTPLALRRVRDAHGVLCIPRRGSFLGGTGRWFNGLRLLLKLANLVRWFTY